MGAVNKEELKSWTKAALQGILSNPAFNSPAYQKWLEMKNMSAEKLAIVSAVECLHQIDAYLAATEKDKMEAAKKAKEEQLELNLQSKAD